MIRSVSAAVLLFVVTVGDAHAIECRDASVKGNGHWSYRLIDGKRCWFSGPRRSKDELHWAARRDDGKQPELPPPPDPKPFEVPPILIAGWPAPAESPWEYVMDEAALAAWADDGPSFEDRFPEYVRGPVIMFKPRYEPPTPMRWWLILLGGAVIASSAFARRQIGDEYAVVEEESRFTRFAQSLRESRRADEVAWSERKMPWSPGSGSAPW